ncbi:izumo sperm-egg fusion protein 4 [Discoglossus pictus]
MVLLAGCTAGCLYCDQAYHENFKHYRKNMNWRTMWAKDRESTDKIINTWASATMKQLGITIAAYIPKDLLKDVAIVVYSKLEKSCNSFSYQPGKFPRILRSIFDYQVNLLQEAIVRTRAECEDLCGESFSIT